MPNHWMTALKSFSRKNNLRIEICFKQKRIYNMYQKESDNLQCERSERERERDWLLDILFILQTFSCTLLLDLLPARPSHCWCAHGVSFS